jgi:hypothetical protein
MGMVTTRNGTEILDKDRREGRPVVATMFGPDGQRVLALIIRLPSLTADQVDQVTSAWKRGDPSGRAHAWAQLNRAATDEERHWILTAAALACREALETARRLDRADLRVSIPEIFGRARSTGGVRRCQRRRSLRADRMTTLHNAHPVVYILWSVCKWLVTRMAGSKVTDRTSIDTWVRSALAGLGAYAEERFRRV